MTLSPPSRAALRRIVPLVHPCDAEVRVPGSKSITNRALIIAALAEGESLLTGALFSNDSCYCAAALNQLGLTVETDEAAATCRISGGGGRIPASTATLYVGNSGTTIRFLTAMVSLGRGTYTLDGTARMRERPIGDLLETLRALGVDARSQQDNGCPPVIVRADGVSGGKARVAADKSSQFLSGLLMAAPPMRDGLDVTIAGGTGTRTALPYVEITRAVMSGFGVEVQSFPAEARYIVAPGQHYQGRTFAIEPDASSASYFFAAAAVTGGRVHLLGLGNKSVQGDMRFLDVLRAMGCRVEQDSTSTTVQGPECLKGVDVDMNTFSDTALTLAAIAPFASTPTRIRNIAHVRLQECDRIAAAVTELTRLGVQTEEYPDGLLIYPATESLRPAEIETYQDHRVAMSFAVTGLRAADISLRDPDCVAKTFPDFFERLDALHAPGSIA